MKKAECKQCGKIFTEYEEGYLLIGETFCSVKCLEAWAVETSVAMTCCDFEEYGEDDEDGNYEGSNNTERLKCKNCGYEIKRYSKHIEYNNLHFCGEDCFNFYMTGRLHV